MRALHALKTCSPNVSGDRSCLLLLPKMAEGTCRVRTLAEAMHADPSTVSRQVSELVDLGLVRREADPNDGRATLLAITPQGTAALEDLRRRRRSVMASVLSDWPDDEIDQLSHLLHAFSAAVGSFTRDDGAPRTAVPDSAPDPLEETS